MSDIKLPILVEPHPWENFESFMYRVVERNALRSVSEIFGALGVPYRKPLWANDHQQLSASLCGGTISLAKIFPTGLDSKTVAIGQQLLKRRHITLTPSRICPHCVAERGYGKLDWNLAPLVVCGEHRTYLIDQCPCTPDSPLQSSRPGYARCSCGVDLLDIPAPPASHDGQALAQEVGRMLRQEPRGDAPSVLAKVGNLPAEMQLGDLLDLIVILGRLDGKSEDLGPLPGRIGQRINRITEQFEKAAYMLSHWPDNFVATLREATGPTFVKSSELSEKLCSILAPARRYLSPHLYRWLTEATLPGDPQSCLLSHKDSDLAIGRG